VSERTWGFKSPLAHSSRGRFPQVGVQGFALQAGHQPGLPSARAARLLVLLGERPVPVLRDVPARRLCSALPHVSQLSGSPLLVVVANVAWYAWFEVRTLAV
jgi:hypothetical protein